MITKHITKKEIRAETITVTIDGIDCIKYHKGFVELMAN